MTPYSIVQNLRHWLRQQQLWLDFQFINREGWSRALCRRQIQRKILATEPLPTSKSGLIEVHCLTWHRDWINLIWALKSFYFYAQVDYPLYIHDGGLTLEELLQLQIHFPNAFLVTLENANRRVELELKRHHWSRCLDYRKKNVAARKLFDFCTFSSTEKIMVIDPDIVFFTRPDVLLDKAISGTQNLYNRDSAYWYSLSIEELKSAFGFDVLPFVNSGLALIHRVSIDFGLINEWLAHPKLFGDTWVTEQTLQALCSHRYGVKLLPDDYCVASGPGLTSQMVCKHYPGHYRHLLYEEGMPRLIERGFLESNRKTVL